MSPYVSFGGPQYDGMPALSAPSVVVGSQVLNGNIYVNDALFLHGAAVYTLAAKGDTTAVWQVNPNGQHFFGSGGSTPVDSRFQRISAGQFMMEATNAVSSTSCGLTFRARDVGAVSKDAAITCGQSGDLFLTPLATRGLVLGGVTDKCGFYGNTGAVKQTVNGSKGGNAALQSLLTALVAMNMITDSTS